MKRTGKILYTFGIFFIISFATMLLAACGSAPKPTPTTAPVASTTALTQPTRTAAPLAPTAAPVVPTTVSAAPTAPSVALQGIAAAFSKTKSLTVYKVSEKISGSGPLAQLAPDIPAPSVLLGEEGVFNGDDFHVKMTGLPAMLFGDDPTKGLEEIQVGGKTYVHGPASALGAPKDSWYLIDPSSGFSNSFSLQKNLDLIAGNGDWSHFTKSRSGESMDGQKCDVYTADKDGAGEKFASLMKSVMSPIAIDSGSAEVWVCDDGYLHAFNGSVEAHDQATPSKTGKIELAAHFFDASVPNNIAAPADAIAATSSNSAAPSSPTTSSQSAPGSSQAAATSINGHWDGNTSTDTPISFDVSDGQITYVNVGYFVPPGCSGSYGTTPDSGTISGNSFSIQLTSDQKQFTFAGTFSSNTEASGTLKVKGTNSVCGAIDVQSKWTAKNGGADSNAATQPTEPPASSSAGSPSTSDADTLQAFFDAVNANDVDTALASVDDNVIYTFGSATCIGKDDLKTYLDSQTELGTTFQLSNVQDNIASVDFTAQAGGKTYQGQAMFQDGVIVILKLK